MKTMTTRTMIVRRRMTAPMKSKAGVTMRRTPNHNVHVITHHGKVMAGRKGRT